MGSTRLLTMPHSTLTCPAELTKPTIPAIVANQTLPLQSGAIPDEQTNYIVSNQSNKIISYSMTSLIIIKPQDLLKTSKHKQPIQGSIISIMKQ